MRTRSSPVRRFATLCLGAAMFSASWATQVVVVRGVNLPIAFAAVALFCVVIDAALAGRLAPRLDAVDALGAALAGWAALSNAWTVWPTGTASVSYYYATCIALFVVARHLCDRPAAMRLVAAAFLGGCLVTTMILLGTRASANPGDVARVTVDGVNANHVAYSLATGFAVCASLWWAGLRSARSTLLLACIALACIVGVLLTGCRSAVVSCAAVICVALFGTLRARSLSKIIAVVAVVVVAIYAFGELPEALQIRLTTLTDASYDPSGRNDLSGRLDLWPLAWRTFNEHPVLGIGAGAFPAVNPLGLAAHNVLLSVAVELGAVGLALYVACVWAAFARGSRASHGPAARSAVTSLLVGWTAIAAAGAWDATFVAWFGFAWMSRVFILSRTGKAVAAASASPARWNAVGARAP